VLPTCLHPSEGLHPWGGLTPCAAQTSASPTPAALGRAVQGLGLVGPGGVFWGLSWSDAYRAAEAVPREVRAQLASGFWGPGWHIRSRQEGGAGAEVRVSPASFEQCQ